MTIFKRALSVLLISLTLLAAGTLLQEALRMYQNNTLKEHPEAVAALRQAAEKGNTDAAFLLGTSYREGKIGRKDPAAAFDGTKRRQSRGMRMRC